MYHHFKSYDRDRIIKKINYEWNRIERLYNPQSYGHAIFDEKACLEMLTKEHF